MSDEQNQIVGAQESGSEIGRIEVVPEILLAIAERNTLRTEGVVRMADIPTGVGRFHSRRLRNENILLSIDDEVVSFEIFVIMDANVNLMDTSRNVQAAIVEGVNNMVGLPVDAVNVHVEDVSYHE